MLNTDMSVSDEPHCKDKEDRLVRARNTDRSVSDEQPCKFKEDRLVRALNADMLFRFEYSKVKNPVVSIISLSKSNLPSLYKFVRY